MFYKPEITSVLREGRRGERGSLTELIIGVLNVNLEAWLEAAYRKDSGTLIGKKKIMSFSCSEKRCREEEDFKHLRYLALQAGD